MVQRVVDALANPDLHVVDPLDALCDSKVCDAEIDGKPLYRDDNHLSADGAVYSWSKIKPSDVRGLAVSTSD